MFLFSGILHELLILYGPIYWGMVTFNQLLSYEKSLPHPFITHFSIGLLQNFRKEFYERIDSQQFFQYLCRYQRFVFDSADFLTVRSEIQKNH